jgi:seryl-tRNA synthetase
MIDIKYIRKNPEAVKELCRVRQCAVDVDRLLQVDEQLRAAIASLESLRLEQKQVMGQAVREQARQLRERASAVQGQVNALEAERQDLWSRLPNLLAPDTPPGESDAENVELSRSGEQPVLPFKAQGHDQLGAQLDILDLPRGAEVAASGFYYWKGAGARLAWAIFSLAIDFLVERGFTFLFTPVLAKAKTMFGTGYLPFSEDQIYKIEGDDLCLIGTSEQTLVGYHQGEILPVAALPLRYTAFTPCFRTEAGSYGSKSRGAFRVHQFHKVEQIVFCRPDESESWHQQCQQNIEDFMDLLAIPYRVVRVCLGDLGAPGYKKYDTEAWFPGFGQYRETHSNTNLLDFQSRRLAIRCKDEKFTFFPHTISATLITDRALIAILENNQQADGSVVIPAVLRPHLGGQETISRTGETLI